MISNKKKIRGWKRKVKLVDNWFELNKEFDCTRFENSGEHYIKIQIDPWNRLGSRRMPNWFFKLILEKMIKIHDLWLEELEANNFKLDLQIWLYENINTRSELVCPKEVNKEYFRRSQDPRDFPAQMWQSSLYDLNRFTWELYLDENFLFQNLYNLDQEEISILRKRGYSEEEINIDGKPEIRFSKKVGYIWVGRLKQRN